MVLILQKSSFEILYANCTYKINLIYINGCFKYIKYLAKCIICYFNNMQMQSFETLRVDFELNIGIPI